MKRIRFWGTLGSLPDALSGAELRARLVTAVKGEEITRAGNALRISVAYDGLEIDL